MLPISSFKIPQTSNTSTRSNLLTQIDAPHEQANGEGQSIVQASENCVVSNQLYGESHTVTTNFFLTASDSNTKLIFEKLNGHAEASRYKPLAQLGTHIEDLRAAYLNVLEEVDEIRDGLTLYIPSEGQETADSKITFTLIDKVREFLSSKKKVLLLLGEAGSGKSTFNRDLTRTLWVEYQQSPAAPIPIFIALAEHTPSCKDLIESYLLEQKFSPEEIAVLRKEKRLVFILDGFDEIKDRMQAFYTQNKLDHWNNAQVIISSRPEYLGHGYRSQFQKRGQTSALQEYWISPISGDWMAAYIKNYIQHAERAEWSFERYQAALDSWPALKESIRRPFLLKMTLELLPSLTESKSTAPITRIALYDEFISRWWSRSEERLHHIELTDKEREVFKRLNEENFLAHGIKFSQDLAIGLHRAQAVVVMYSEAVDGKREDDWRKEFLGNSEKARLLRFNAPLIRQGDQYWFIHKSIQDYCVARAICGPQFNSAQPAINAVLNRFLVVDEPLILDFLAERVKQYPSFKAHLHAWIESSKNPNTPVTVGAANAITILVRAGIQFNGADLNGVRIPGADLSYGVFDSAQLQGSDLRGVNLRTSWLREANLSGAQMADVQFGEWPYLEEDSNVESCAYSPDGENYVVGLANGKIRVYWTSNWEKMHTLKGHTNVIGSVMYSPSGLQLASGSDDKTVRLWDPRSGALLHTLEGHTGWVTSMVYSPSGLQLASGSDDKTVRLWDTQIGALFRTLDGHTSRVNSVVYSLSGLQLASGSDDKTVRLWDTQNGALFRTLEGHTREIKSVLYSPSGLQLASECKGHTVLLWDPQSGALVHTLEGYTGSVKLLYSTNVSSMAYSPSGLQLALGGDDNAIRLWDSQSGALVHTLKGHTSSVNSVTYSPNGLQLASGAMITPSVFGTLKAERWSTP
ncbi:hypothetical protein EBME_0351 [bacterium endosymbiont of Mortierella elongata FMR23-6]|nr:hypothetical protein EBME_0351 [bacterium endosymbiont of Mortierella elongata FMR23-6]